MTAVELIERLEALGTVATAADDATATKGAAVVAALVGALRQAVEVGDMSLLDHLVADCSRRCQDVVLTEWRYGFGV